MTGAEPKQAPDAGMERVGLGRVRESARHPFENHTPPPRCH